MSIRTMSLQRTSAAVYNKTKSDAYPKGSVYFDGTGDYISIPPSILLGSSTFCVEMWVKPTTTTPQIWFASPGPTFRDGVAIGQRYGTLWWLLGNGSAWVFERNASVGPTSNAWNHVVVNRTGGVAQLFLNGSRVDAVSDSTYITQGTSWDAGQYAGGYNLTGHLSNLRAVIGDPVYTGTTYTVPTKALTSVSGTALLTCQNPNVIRDNGPSNLTITAYGNAAAAATSPFG